MLPLYFSGELDAKVMSDFELHLADCAGCRRETEQQKSYDDLLRVAIVSEPADARPLCEIVSDRISKPVMITWLFRRPAYLFAIAVILLLALGTTVVYLATRSKPVEIVYADAVDDHYDEVIKRVPLDGWRATPADINTLGQKELGESGVIERLAPDGYRIARARLCDLAGEAYVHVEFQNENGEISIFIKRREGNLPGAAKEVVNNCPIHLVSTRGFEVAGFQSAKFTVLIVSNLSSTENLRLVRESAARLA